MSDESWCKEEMKINCLEVLNLKFSDPDFQNFLKIIPGLYCCNT